MEQKMYMTTGELARLMGITKETLFIMTKLDYFQPEIVKENGYRYYAIYQMEALNTILLLRDLGMPLKRNKIHIRRAQSGQDDADISGQGTADSEGTCETEKHERMDQKTSAENAVGLSDGLESCACSKAFRTLLCIS